MATLIPAIDFCKQRMTPGERRFAERLESHLEDDYLLWYDVPVGKQHLHPDFIILHPSRGIFVLEVKDWKLNNIDCITPDSVFLLSAEKQVANPLEQARHYAYAVQEELEADPALVQQEGKYKGRLQFPYGYGVVLTNITRKQFESNELAEVLPPDRVICQDEMYERVDPLEFQERIWNLSEYQFGIATGYV